MRIREIAVGLTVYLTLCANGSAATFSVTNANDSGAGSLRQAIMDANADALADQITFSIPGVNVHTIAVASPLPAITQPVVIDGYTQDGANPNSIPVGSDANLRIELDGAGLSGATAIGLDVRAPSEVRGLVINRFAGAGISVNDAVGGTQITGCYIGTNAAGAAALPNAAGIVITNSKNVVIGGTAPAFRNVISGNTTGLSATSSQDSTIAGNYLGTNSSGLAALLNATSVSLFMTTNITIGGTIAGAGNVILSSNSSIDISANSPPPGTTLPIVGSGTHVEGNYVGVNASGVLPTGIAMGSIDLHDNTHDNVVGGPDGSFRNIIAHSVSIRGANTNLVQGNYIGTDSTGLAAVNGALGVAIESVAGAHVTQALGNTVDSNVISAPGRRAVSIIGAANTNIRRNFIGVSADGVTPLPAPDSGIYASGLYLTSADASGTIGGTEPGAGNIIANAAHTGITISPGGVYRRDEFFADRPGADFRINGNSIYGNSGLGIDLVPPGSGSPPVTPNDGGDSDDGPNRLQNFPVLTYVAFSGGSAHIVGTLNSAPNKTYRIELFGNPDADPSGYGQGKYYLGFRDVTTDAAGDASFDVTVPCPSDTHTVSSTATDEFGFTSEFSATVFAQLQNISTRARVQTGDNRMIGGFIVTGADPKRVLVRAIGPSLEISGVPFAGRLEDPVLDLFDADGVLLASDDNWRDAQEAEIEETGLAPEHDLESAILRTLMPGSYSAIMGGKHASSGVGVVEVYDLAPAATSKLANISTRAFVETGENVMIGGFIVGPTDHGLRVFIRGLGPSLANQNVPEPLQDPVLELRDQAGTLVAMNDDWIENAAEVQPTGAAPQDSRESALVADLPAGSYTAIVSGKDATSGVAVVEIYQLQ